MTIQSPTLPKAGESDDIAEVVRAAVLSFCLFILTVLASCAAPPIKPVLTDPDPSVKIPAIKLAVDQKDRSAIPVMVKNLDSDDPAIRFYAIDGLRKLTGQDFGYLYYLDEDGRRPAAQKWHAWLASTTKPVTDPPTNPPTNPATQP